MISKVCYWGLSKTFEVNVVRSRKSREGINSILFIVLLKLIFSSRSVFIITFHVSKCIITDDCSRTYFQFVHYTSPTSVEKEIFYVIRNRIIFIVSTIKSRGQLSLFPSPPPPSLNAHMSAPLKALYCALVRPSMSMGASFGTHLLLLPVLWLSVCNVSFSVIFPLSSVSLILLTIMLPYFGTCLSTLADRRHAQNLLPFWSSFRQNRLP